MKFTAIHLPMIWLVLHAVPTLVLGGSLRGLSSSLSAEETFLGGGVGYIIRKTPRPRNTTPPPTTLPPTTLPPTTPCPTVGRAEVWIGLHPIRTDFDEAKIWVISSNSNHHTAFTDVTWKQMTEENMPTEFEGDVRCAKYFSIGAGAVSSPILVAGINREDDVSQPLEQAVLVRQLSSTDLLAFKTAINSANQFINHNFAKMNPNGKTNTILKYKLLPHWLYQPGTMEEDGDWYKMGYGWVAFNSNGYISGLLSHLGYGKAVRPAEDSRLIGWDKPIPTAFFRAVFSTVDAMKKEVYSTHKCMGGLAEVWVGYHPVFSDEQNVWIDHAKIWVISSKASHHTPADKWKALRPELVPSGYEGDINCAKFYTLGSGFDQNELIGVVNYSDDTTFELSGAVKVFSGIDPIRLMTKINAANEILRQTFANTILKREAFPQNFNPWGLGWNEFNGNGYISGFLNYLTSLGLDLEGTEPCGGNLIGWNKDVPIEFFKTIYSTDDDVKNEIFNEHPADKAIYNEDVSTQVSTASEETQLTLLDPNLSSSSTPLELAPEELEVANEVTQQLLTTSEETQQLSLDPNLSSSSTPLELTPEELVQLVPTDEPLFRAKQL